MRSIAIGFVSTFALLFSDVGEVQASIHVHSTTRAVSANVWLQVPGSPPPFGDGDTDLFFDPGVPVAQTITAHLAMGTPLRDGEAIASINSPILMPVGDTLLFSAAGGGNVDFDRLQGNELQASATAQSELALRFSVDTPSNFSFVGSLTESGADIDINRTFATLFGSSGTFFEFDGPASASHAGVLSPGIIYFLDVLAEAR